MLASWQRSLIYHPLRVAAVRPQEFGWSANRCQQIEVIAPDQTVLHGWMILAHGNHAQSDEEFDEQLQLGRPLILYFCGNGGHRGYRQASVATLARLGCDVVICDYRGYGDNLGTPSEFSLIADAHAIWNYLTELRRIDGARIILYGESLGGGIASALASDVCQSGTPPGGLILQSTFPSLVRAGQYHFPWLPVSWVLIDRYPSAERVRSVTCPILQIHGRLDDVVPWSMGAELAEAIPAQSSSGMPKSLMELPRTNHNWVYHPDSPDREQLLNGLRKFFENLRR